MTNEFCLVTTALDDRESAYRLASRLVEMRLAACVQVTSVGSTYHWKGKVETVDEYLLTIKTLARLYTSLEKAIREEHPYEIPEILQLSIDGGFQPYIDWMRESLNNQ